MTDISAQRRSTVHSLYRRLCASSGRTICLGVPASFHVLHRLDVLSCIGFVVVFPLTGKVVARAR